MISKLGISNMIKCIFHVMTVSDGPIINTIQTNYCALVYPLQGLFSVLLASQGKVKT